MIFPIFFLTNVTNHQPTKSYVAIWMEPYEIRLVNGNAVQEVSAIVYRDVDVRA